MKYLDLGIDEINKLLKEKKIKPIDLVEEALQIAKRADDVDKFDVIKDIKKFD